ncbi:MAG TPA: low molecular weight protein-tyrosine-phosphatase [Mycobacteriales bacterium]
MPRRVLFVCSGNICRSPTAEAVMRRLVADAGLSDVIEVDGAGTGDWHAGQPPDPRATEAAARRGIQLTGLARQVTRSDFDDADLILAVDDENLLRLREMAPASARAHVRRLDDRDVPDPYYGGPGGFDAVLDQVEAACRRLLEEIRSDDHEV